MIHSHFPSPIINIVMKMLQEAMKQSSKGTVAAYKENIRQYLTEQFDEIIEDARKEIEESGEGVGTALADLQQLKQTMSAVLDAKLDELEGLLSKDCQCRVIIIYLVPSIRLSLDLFAKNSEKELLAPTIWKGRSNESNLFTVLRLFIRLSHCK